MAAPLGTLYTLRDSIEGNIRFRKHEIQMLENWLARVDEVIATLGSLDKEGGELIRDALEGNRVLRDTLKENEG